jgi:RNA polymerase sigma factor for flagellar operon FliA
MRFAVELDDLIGYGTIGLVRAVERFDPSRGILLKTYAEHRIRGAILDGLRGMDWLPRSARQKERQAHNATDSASPLDSGARARKALLPHSAAPRRAGNGQTQSPAAYVPRMEAVIPGGNLSDLERLAMSHTPRHSLGPNPESLYEKKERFDKLAEAVLGLPRRHREVIDLYYRGELSMKQIGARLHVHESRVSQLHSAAIQNLRRHLGGVLNSDARHVPVQKVSAKRPLEPYRRVAKRRHTACQSSSVSTPMVSCAVSAT